MQRQDCNTIGYYLIDAVREGRLERVREIISRYDLSYSKPWSDGYNLLRDAIEFNHTAITKLLLESGCKVISKNKKPVNTPLHFAVKNGDIEIVELLLDKGVDINAKNKYGRTPLHESIAKNKIAVSELLLKHRADVNAKDFDGKRPLHVAIEAKCLQMVEHLLKQGAYVNCECTCSWREGYTPLHFAVERDSKEFVNLLLNSGANVNAKAKDGTTPLHIASEKGYSQIVEHLLKHGVYIHCVCSSKWKEGYTPLHLAVENDSEEVIKMLLNSGADIHANNTKNLTPLYIATEKGKANVVKLLLEHGANVDTQDKNNKTILYLAAEKGYSAIIDHILKYCPDLNNKSNSLSLNAAVHGRGKEYSQIVESLLQYGFAVDLEDANNCELMHAAIEKGCLKIVEDLLKNGTDVNMLYSPTFKNGYIPLYDAIQNKHDKVAALLIKYGADVNAKDKVGKSLIFYAIEKADLNITKLLLSNGADIKDNPELLHIAVKKKCKEIVEVLLQHDADINASDGYGRTALYFTAISKNLGVFDFFINEDEIKIKAEIAKLLLSRGANVDAQTKNGTTILHAAIQSGYAKVVAGLLEYNANVNSVGKNDITPLLISAQYGNKVISSMLLYKGANVNAKQKDGITALHIATQKGHKEIVEILLKFGAEVDSKIKRDITSLHIAAQKGYLEIVMMLLKFGADIDSKDEYGIIPLHIASKEGHEEIVVALLEYGSDIYIRSKNHQTPLDFAMAGIDSFYRAVNNYYDSDDDYDYDPDRGICACEIIAKILKQHMIKIETANLYGRKKLQSISSYDKTSDFQKKCEKEMESMQSEKISNSNVSFRDILTKNINQLTIYARNENIVQVLQSNDYKRKFPIYASMINGRFRKGLEKKELLEHGKRFLYFLFNSFPELPYNCVEKIMSYLTDKDLRIIIDVCKPVHSPNQWRNYFEAEEAAASGSLVSGYHTTIGQCLKNILK